MAARRQVCPQWLSTRESRLSGDLYQPDLFAQRDLQCVHSSGWGSPPTTRRNCLPAVPGRASISQCLVHGLCYVWNLLLVCGDLFSLKHTLPPDATPLASRRTVLAWNGSTWYCYCNSGHILFRHLLC